MITAHLPSGYVLYHSLPSVHRQAPWVFAAAILGAILPDLDLFWFYFVDDRAFHHHRYWVHAPAFWAFIAIVTLPLIAWLKPHLNRAATVFFLALFVHVFLVSLVGDIMWLWPVSNEMYAVFSVSPTHENWILSFLLHWSFGFALAIWATALALFLKRR